MLRPLLPGVAWLLLAGLILEMEPIRAAEAPAPPFYALLVGGGPDVASNAAQIEGHMSFVAGTVPGAARRLILFADGKIDHPSVSYADTSAPADAQRALAVLLADQDAGEPILGRAPKLGVTIDGRARLQEVRRAMAKLLGQATTQPAPLLLYFAGHGTQGDKKDQDTAFDLWDDDKLTVRTLADELARAPRQLPVVLVMAQCFSGAFANLLFTHGDADGSPLGANLVGFFSAKADREAAGCSYATDRADYQDFSSYFFGALCGQDRFGGTVVGADYDGDGTVSLYEAFCYALIHDQSADTPVCTSDVFLRRSTRLPDETIYATPYHAVWQAGTAAQRAVLDALSGQLGLAGEKRAIDAFDRLTYSDPPVRPPLVKAQGEAKEELDGARSQALGPVLERWPMLRWRKRGTADYDQAFAAAANELVAETNVWRPLLEVEKAHERADEAVDDEEAALLRFAGMYEHIVEVGHLREHGKAETKAQFERLWKGEQQTLPLARVR